MTSAEELEPEVSVVIPAYNVVGVIDAQLAALAAQESPPSFEVVVSDNGSTDDLRHHLTRTPWADLLDIRWCDSSERRGVSYARNVGARASRAPFIAICDADDEVGPTWLRDLYQAAQSADLVGGSVSAAGINDPDVAQWRRLPPEGELAVACRFLPYTYGANTGVWRPVFEAVGGWDESFVAGGDDVDFSWRVQLAGYSIAAAAGATVGYRFRDTMRGMWSQAYRYQQNEGRLIREFGSYGARRRTSRSLRRDLRFIVRRSPLLVRDRAARGYWVNRTASLAGRLAGGLKHRVLVF